MPDKKIKKLVDNSKANFVKRLKQANRSVIPDWGSNFITTHKLSVGTDKYGNHFIYPEVQEVNGNLIDYTRPPYHPFMGQDNAIERGDTVIIGNTDKDLNDAIKFTENYKKYYPGFKTGGKIKHKIEAEGGEVIQSNKPFKIKRGGIAISLGNGFSLLQGKTHKEGGIDIDMKGDGRIWSNVPMINGKSPAKRLIDGENPNLLFNQQELIKNRLRINDDGTKKALGGFTDFNDPDKKNKFKKTNKSVIGVSKPNILKTKNVKTLNSFKIANSSKTNNSNKNRTNNKETKINNSLINDIKQRENFSSTVYKDTRGIETVGYGETDKAIIEYAKKKGGITKQEAHNFLIKRLNKLNDDTSKVIKSEVWENLYDDERNAILDILYNGGVNGSPKMIEHINNGKWDEAVYEMNTGIGNPNSKGNTKRRIFNQISFRDRLSENALEKMKDVYDYAEQNPEDYNKIFEMVEQTGVYKNMYDKYKQTKEFGGKINNGMIYHVNGNITNSSRYLPFKGKRPKAWLGLSTSDLINLGGNIIGSIASYAHGRSVLNKIPAVPKPVMQQPVKLNTTYNINPQLNSLTETESYLLNNIAKNTTSSNTAVSRMQKVKLNSLLSKNELFNTKNIEENKLINADKLNRQEIIKDNIERENKYLNEEYERKVARRKSILENSEGLLSNLIGTLNQTAYKYDKHKQDKVNFDLKMLELKSKMGKEYHEILDKYAEEYRKRNFNF